MAFLRPRLSLLNAVLLITIAALGLGLIASSSQRKRILVRNEQLVAENKVYRDRLGVFDIEDERQVHAIRLPGDDESGWYFRYRIYLPEGRTYRLHYGTSRVPAEGLPEYFSDVRADLQPGEYVIATRFEPRFDPKTGERIPHATLTIRVQPEDDQLGSRSTTSIGLGEREQDWIVNKDTQSPQFGALQIRRELEVHAPEAPLVLVRARPRRVLVRQRSPEGLATSYSTEPISDPSDGFIVWVQPAEQQPETQPAPVVAE